MKTTPRILFRWSLLLLALLSATTVASPKHDAPKKESLQLSEPLKKLLQAEMQQVHKAMQSLITAMAMADWQTIEKLGKGIHDSFILKQKITQQQLHELHQSLPRPFKMMDKNFHRYAGMMSHVAKERDMELVQFYFAQMTESCSACHSQFAVERFPGFKEKNKHASGKH